MITDNGSLIVLAHSHCLGSNSSRLGDLNLLIVTESTISNCYFILNLNPIQLHFTGISELEFMVMDLKSVQSSSVALSCPILCSPMDCSTPGFPVHHLLLELTQTHVHQVGDAIQPSHPLSSPSPPAFNLSQHQGLFQWVSSSNQVAKVLEFRLQHQPSQWIVRTDFP